MNWIVVEGGVFCMELLVVVVIVLCCPIRMVN